MRVVVVGASGQGKVVADLLEQSGEHEVVGFVDSVKPAGTPWAGYAVLGPDVPDGVEGAVLALGDNAVRARVAEGLRHLQLPAVVHPSATVARSARLGAGVLVLAGAVVGADAVLEEHSMLNTRASLDHDSVLGRAASLAPGAVTGGNVRIGALTAVGLGAVVSHGRTVGAHTVVGAGSVVVRDLPDRVVAYGSPARVVRSRAEGEPYL